MLFKKEKEVVELIIRHIDKVEECLLTALQTLQAYLKGDMPQAKNLCRRTNSTETEADLIRHSVRDKLYSGAYLPLLREDIYKLVESEGGLLVTKDGREVGRITQQGSRWTLANACVERVVETKPFLHTVSITNKLTAETRPHPVESRGFVLSLDNNSLRFKPSKLARATILEFARRHGVTVHPAASEGAPPLSSGNDKPIH